LLHRVVVESALWAVLAPGLSLSAQQNAPIVNLAAQSAGGHLVFFSSQYNETDWAAANLIDGPGAKTWSGQSGGPQTVILGFEDNRLAEIQDILVNPYSRESPNNWRWRCRSLCAGDSPPTGQRESPWRSPTKPRTRASSRWAR